MSQSSQVVQSPATNANTPGQIFTPQMMSPPPPKPSVFPPPMPPSADRLTDLQNQLDHLAFMMFTCVGVVQRDAPPVPIYNLDTKQPQESQDAHKQFREQVLDMAQQVARTTKNIDKIIETLPADSTEEKQLEYLERLHLQSLEIEKQYREKLQYAGSFLYVISLFRNLALENSRSSAKNYRR